MCRRATSWTGYIVLQHDLSLSLLDLLEASNASPFLMRFKPLLVLVPLVWSFVVGAGTGLRWS